MIQQKKEKKTNANKANQNIDSNHVNNNNNDIVVGMISMPEYINGGEDSMMAFISKNIALRDSVYGRVVVTFTIDKEGNVKDERILKSLSTFNDQEVLRVVKLLKFKKQTQDFYYQLPVIFDPE